MTDFDTLESSQEDSRPIEIYSFAISSDEWFYTSAQDDISLSGDTYEAIAIQRSKIEQGADARNRNLTVTMPASEGFSEQYINVPPRTKATLSIIRLQRDESPTFNTQALIYKGVVQSVRFPNNGTIAEIALRGIETAASQRIPRYTFMSQCNHLLYDGSCGVSIVGNNHSGAVTSISGNDVTISGLSASGIDGTGGYCQNLTSQEFRMVLSQSSDTITMLLPFIADPTGLTVQVFRGCDHNISGDCATQFDNIVEFGGWPFVPSRNIFSSGIDD